MKINIRHSNIKRKRHQGFLTRMRTKGGKQSINDRRRRGRKRLTSV